jgi:L-cystine transport system ATP-binding protein
MIEIHDLHKSFGKNKVLNGIDLTVEAGSVVVILGPSGSGKSTLLRCINLLEIPQRGTLKLGDIQVSFSDLQKKHILDIRRNSAMVFQGCNLFLHKTALQNITEGLIVVRQINKKEAVDIARNYLDKVGLLNKENHYPAQLSGGQQQRVAIARALAMNPKVILFDEPTSALDPELVQEVLMVMRDLAKEGITMVVVTHEMSFARDIGTQVVFIDEGRILEQAEPKAFFQSPNNEKTRRFLRKISTERTYNVHS